MAPVGRLGQVVLRGPGPGRGRNGRRRLEEALIWTAEKRGGGRVCWAEGAEDVGACADCFVVAPSFLSVMEPVCVVPAPAAFSLILRDAMADQPVPPAHSSCSLRLLNAQKLSSNIALSGGCEGVAKRLINPRSLVAPACNYIFAARSWLRCIRGPDIGIRDFKGSNVRILGPLTIVNFCSLKEILD